MCEGKPVRDRSFKFPVSVDARKNPRICDEAIRKEQKFFWNNKTPAQAAASPTALAMALKRAVAQVRFDRDRLLELARRYDSRAAQSLLAGVLAASAS